MKRFPSAPWPASLKAISAAATLLLLAVGYAAARSVPPPAAGIAHSVGWIVACVPPAVALGALLFVVRGYEIDRSRLRVQRLLWFSEIRLGGLKQVWHDPRATEGSLKVAGNGGLFSFTGVFRNKTLGRYRAFATDPKRAVVLVLPGRTVVVTPADPNAFVQHVRVIHPQTQGKPV